MNVRKPTVIDSPTTGPGTIASCTSFALLCPGPAPTSIGIFC
jgi:hypothetical protein